MSCCTLRRMQQETATALLVGGFTLAGGLGGSLLTGWLSRGTERRRIEAEDERRWLTDRRTAFAQFLGLSESMLRDIDSAAVFLPGHGRDASAEDDEIRVERLYDYIHMWETELQGALGEVELLATPEVVDLADRVSTALIEVTAPVELRSQFEEYYPMWFQARDLLEVLRNAMRTELGLSSMSVDDRTTARRANDYPWLADRPARQSYVQHHPRLDE